MIEKKERIHFISDTESQMANVKETVANFKAETIKLIEQCMANITESKDDFRQDFNTMLHEMEIRTDVEIKSVSSDLNNVKQDLLEAHTKVSKLDDAPFTNKIECFYDAHGYMTTRSTTQSGLKCQRWDIKTPHKHKYADSQFPKGSKCKARNYCRDPGNDGYLWCFTTDPDRRWETCGIPWCNEPKRNNNEHDCYLITDQDKKSGMSEQEICRSQGKTKVYVGSEDAPPGCEDCDGCCQTKDCDLGYPEYYSGTWHRGESGRECQRWDSQVPHKHDNNEDSLFPRDSYSVTAANNYCRDPTESGYLWCYTMDPNVRWEKCVECYS